AGALTHQALAARGAPAEMARGSEAAPAAAPAAQPKAPRENARDDKDTVTYAGRVLDAAGKPVAGASVYYHFITREDEPTPARATTAPAGRFPFTLPRRDVPLSADAIQSDPLRTGQVVVKAAGFTFAWKAAPKQPGDLSLRLAADDAPVEGR